LSAGALQCEGGSRGLTRALVRQASPSNAIRGFDDAISDSEFEDSRFEDKRFGMSD